MSSHAPSLTLTQNGQLNADSPKSMLTIIDYGIGNLRSIEKAFEAVGAEVERTDDVARIEKAGRLVLPGVGAFGACMAEIRKRGLVTPILEAVERGTPFLGVCVGMQLLFEESTEQGTHPGLGILPGRVVHFSDSLTQNGAAAEELKIPHMGWNTVEPRRKDKLVEGIDEGAFFYFVHSYHARPEREGDVLAATRYGVEFPAMVAKDNVFGVQFHPEKSQQAGLKLLRNFAAL